MKQNKINIYKSSWWEKSVKLSSEWSEWVEPPPSDHVPHATDYAGG